MSFGVYISAWDDWWPPGALSLNIRQRHASFSWSVRNVFTMSVLYHVIIYFTLFLSCKCHLVSISVHLNIGEVWLDCFWTIFQSSTRFSFRFPFFLVAIKSLFFIFQVALCVVLKLRKHIIRLCSGFISFVCVF